MVCWLCALASCLIQALGPQAMRVDCVLERHRPQCLSQHPGELILRIQGAVRPGSLHQPFCIQSWHQLGVSGNHGPTVTFKKSHLFQACASRWNENFKPHVPATCLIGVLKLSCRAQVQAPPTGGCFAVHARFMIHGTASAATRSLQKRKTTAACAKERTGGKPVPRYALADSDEMKGVPPPLD